MKTASVRDLRNDFAKIEAWILDGEEVCIQKRGKPIALITAMRGNREPGVKNPDFEARRRAIWGDRVFSGEEVRAMREAEQENEREGIAVPF